MPSLVLIKSSLQPPPVREVELSAEPLLIGKATDSHVVLPDNRVSKRHARVTFADGQHYLEDLGSHNKTYLNGDLVPKLHPLPLRPYDQIRICGFVFTYRVEDEPVRMELMRNFLVSPAERLRALMELHAAPASPSDMQPLLALVADALFGTAATRVVAAGPLLTQIAETLLAVFRQAQRCYLLLLDEGGTPVPRVVHDRAGIVAARDRERFNRAIVRRATESICSYLATAEGANGTPPRAVMCVPLATSEDRAFGAIQIETRDNESAFAAADLDLFTILGNFTSVALDRLQTQAQAQAQALVKSQIDTAWEVQRGFLPQTPPVVPGYEFFSHYSPALTLSGDYYDFIPLHDGRMAVVLGDVSGKGVPAALLVAKLSSEVRSCLLQCPDPAAAVARLNQQLIRGGLKEGQFVTLVAMLLDPARHRLAVVTAGHDSPRLYSVARRELRELVSDKANGPALGFIEGAQYTAVTIELAPQETVTAYTDGVTEAHSPNSKLFGTAEADRHLAPREAVAPDAARPYRVGESLLAAVRRHANGRAQSDDIALVSFGRWEPADPDTLSGMGFEHPPSTD